MFFAGIADVSLNGFCFHFCDIYAFSMIPLTALITANHKAKNQVEKLHFFQYLL